MMFCFSHRTPNTMTKKLEIRLQMGKRAYNEPAQPYLYLRSFSSEYLPARQIFAQVLKRVFACRQIFAQLLKKVGSLHGAALPILG